MKNCAYLECFEREGSAEVSVGIFRVFLDHDVEICHRLVMVVNHLVGFGSLVHVPDVRRNSLDAAGVRIDRLFELLNTAVGKTNMVEDVRLIGQKWFVLEC